MKKLCITALVLCVLLCVFVGCGIAPAPNGSVETTEAPETSNQHIGETTASPEASRPNNGETTDPSSTSKPSDGDGDTPSEPSSPNDEDWLLTLEYLDPAIFGAVGDGKTDDIDALELAAHVASKMGKILKLPQKEYYTSRPLVLNDVEVLSENAKISFYGMQASVPAVDMQTNVTIRGKLRIWTVDNTSVANNHGGRCAMGFGNYNTGVGAYNCYVEDLEVSGGYYNANGILITGDSSMIEIEKINIIGADTIGRGVLIHWGNANDHYPEYVDGKWTGNYLHKPNCDYTTHPHDIKFGTVICDDLSNKEGDAAAFYIAGAYSITVDEILADNVRHALTITGGDGGFSYASPIEKAHGSKNVRVNKIVGTDINSYGIFYTVESGYKDIPIFYGELVLGEVTLSYKSDYKGIGPSFNGIGSLLIHDMTLIGLQTTSIYFINDCSNIHIASLTMKDCKTPNATLFYIVTEEKYISDPTVGTDGLLLQELILDNSAYGRLFLLRNTTKNVHLQNLTLKNNTSVAGAIFHVDREIPSESNITVGKESYNDIPLQSGAACTVTVKTDMILMGSGETLDWDSVEGIKK